MSETTQFDAGVRESKTSALGPRPDPKATLQQFIIPLDAGFPNVNDNGERRIPGTRFWVDVKTTGIAQAFFDDNSAQLGGIPCIPGLVIKMPMEYVYIVAPPQPGAVLVFNWGVFDVVPPFFDNGTAPAIGSSYGAAYKSSTALVANTPDNIFAAASNVNGASLIAAGYDCGQGAQPAVMLAKLSAVAPTGILDGDAYLQASNQAIISSLPNAIRISPGRRFDRISGGADGSTYAYALYTLLQ